MSGRVDLWWAEVRDAADRRALLRDVVSRYLRCHPEEVVLRRGASGRPELDRPGSRLRFSSSSSGPIALFAVTDGAAVGVDVERTAHGALLPGTEHLFLSAAERRRVAELAPASRPVELLRLWTVKEALAKALGTGLATDPTELELRPPWRGGVVPTAGDVVAALVVHGGWAECLQRRVQPTAAVASISTSSREPMSSARTHARTGRGSGNQRA
jgi:phosphopantetheinyl transferase (holo-ACP synthase)